MQTEQEILDVGFELEMLHAYHKNGCLDVRDATFIRQILDTIHLRVGI